MWSKEDKQINYDIFNKTYNEHGYSHDGLGWAKGKQAIRFDMLTEDFGLNTKGKDISILDIGCGFAQLGVFLKHKYKDTFIKYTGIETVASIYQEAVNQTQEYDFILLNDDFFDTKLSNFDICVASGIFNAKLSTDDNYNQIEQSMQKAFNLCNIGIAYDFLSDTASIQHEINHYASASEILKISQKLSKNVLLKHNYMPFEFSVIIFKDDSFKRETTLFQKYEREKNITDIYSIVL
ncbi:MAG: hypothetical protein FWE05_02300 [Defluviitaleaceae bacterium]|nr:hypothetical protein [Defluviitaleaceae bacterium]